MPRLLLTLLVTCSLFLSTAYASQWTPFTDDQGHLYLLQSPAVIATPDGEVTEIYRPGSFIRVEFIDGEWVAVPMTQRQWRAQSLTPGHEDVVQLSYEAVGPDGLKRLIVLAERDGVQYHLRFSKVGRTLAMESVNLEEAGASQPQFRMMSAGGDSSLLAPTDHEATTANFRVDESGAATIQIPIYTPEGVAGVTPSLSFSYSSRGGDGPMGMGWSLSANGAITRCPQNIAQDGAAAGVSFDSGDRLCLNGTRIQGTSSTNYWGSSYYVPELDPSTRVHPYRVGGEIRAFVVETKAGELHYYGDLNAVTGAYAVSASVPFSARSDALFKTHPTMTSAVKNVPKMWAQKATADIMGNYIEYTYTNLPTAGEHYLTGVRYTLRSGQAPMHEISVSTDARRKKKGWFYGTPVLSSRKISGLKVFSHGAVVRNYRIDYRGQNIAEDKLFVDGIQECSVNNGAERCKYPVTFDWQRPASAALDPIIICDPLSPHICWEEPQQNDWDIFDSQVSYRSTKENAATQIITDFTGNGHADFVYIQSGQWRIREGGLPQTRCTNNASIAGYCYHDGSIGPYTADELLGSTGANQPSRALTIDYDGSGKRALLVADDNELIWRIRGLRPTLANDGCELSFTSGALRLLIAWISEVQCKYWANS